MKVRLKKFILENFNLVESDMVYLDKIVDRMIVEIESLYEDEPVSEYVLYDMFDEFLFEELDKKDL